MQSFTVFYSSLMPKVLRSDEMILASKYRSCDLQSYLTFKLKHNVSSNTVIYSITVIHKMHALFPYCLQKQLCKCVIIVWELANKAIATNLTGICICVEAMCGIHNCCGLCFAS